MSLVAYLTYNSRYDTISAVTITQHAFSYMLRHSGAVLKQVEHGDVRLERRDGPDVVLVTARREESVRDGLDLAARALAVVLRDPKMGRLALGALEEALPWVGWLSPNDRSEFATSFVRTAQACRATGGYEPLAKLLHRWKVSAQIVHDPLLVELLGADRGDDLAVVLERPTV